MRWAANGAWAVSVAHLRRTLAEMNTDHSVARASAVPPLSLGTPSQAQPNVRPQSLTTRPNCVASRDGVVNIPSNH